jgi:hypothetical protein
VLAVEIRYVSSTILRGPLLQWGHGVLAVEIVADLIDAGFNRIASMGPRRVSRGNKGLYLKNAELNAASMGPRRVSRGNGLSLTP